MESVVIPSDFRAAKEAQQQVLAAVAEHGYDECDTFAIRLAMEEGLNNAIRHGNAGDVAKHVTLAYEIDSEKAVVVITDEGTGFTPERVPDPTADENLEKPSGRGIMLIHAYMDEVGYNERGNQIRMVKYRR